MGSQGTDVVLSKAAYEKFPFSCEAKNQEVNKVFINMWEQATENSEGDAMLVLSSNNSPVLAVVELEYLLKVLNGRV